MNDNEKKFFEFVNKRVTEIAQKTGKTKKEVVKAALERLKREKEAEELIIP